MGRTVPKCGPHTGSSTSPRSLLEMQMLGPTRNLLNQDPWAWGPGTCVLTNHLMHTEV